MAPAATDAGMLTDDELREWVREWRAHYPDDQDAVLEPLVADHLDRAALQTVIDWKFVVMPHRRAKARRALERENDRTITEVTSAARQCADDGAALRVMRVLHGVGPALGSAALMVMDRDRWTVLDVRAVKSIRSIGYTQVPEDSQHSSTWVPYLTACRQVADRVGEHLRVVDRALFAASGRRPLPDAG